MPLGELFSWHLLGWPAGITCVLANVQIFRKISFYLGGRDSPTCVFSNAFHIHCSNIGEGVMSCAKQVTSAGMCQPWLLPCHGVELETDLPPWLQNIAAPQQAFLTASNQCSVSSKSSKNCFLGLKPGPLQRKLLSN